MAIERWPFYFQNAGICMFARIILPIIILSACSSTRPTPYQKEKKKQGYSDLTEETINISSFKANSYTKPQMAKAYAEFRAIDNCLQQQKIANIFDISDRTIQKTVTRTSGASMGPSYGMGLGMYPYYSRYSSFALGVGWNTVNTDSWNETLIFPIMDIYYTCSDKVFRPQILLKEISAEQMKLLVKDLKGALQVEKILDNSPNQNVIEPGDLILKVNGGRIENIHELIHSFDDKQRSVSVEILREGLRKIVQLNSIDVTPEVQKSEQEIIAQVCKNKKAKNQDELKTHRLCN